MFAHQSMTIRTVIAVTGSAARMRWARWIALPALAMASAMPLSAAEAPCTGHEGFPTPRQEGSCRNVAAQVIPSPDKAMRAVVVPASISLDTTPDMESRVVIRSSTGSTVLSKDYSSPRGMNGYYVVQAKWSPDSQFFVYSLSSSGGHSPWSFPIWVYGRKANRFASFSDMIKGNPTVSADFTFAGPHTLTASTWKKPGEFENKVPVTVDLEAAFGKLPPEP
jgi:hypothetical protein